MKTATASFLTALLAACSDAGTSPSVVPPPPPPANVAVSYCAGQEPVWVAFQDGDGAWTRALPRLDNGKVVFETNVQSARAAVATVTPSSSALTFLQVLYGTPEELATIGYSSPASCGSAFVETVHGIVAGVDTNEFAVVRGGFGSQTLATPGNEFLLDLPPFGPQDILATRITRRNGTDTMTKIILRRSVDPANPTLAAFDFDAAEAFQPAVGHLTLSGVGIGGASIATRLVTSQFNSTFGIVRGQDVGTVGPYFAIPDAELVPGDLQELIASGHGATPNSTRSASLFFHAVQDYTIGLGGDVVTPTFTTVATTPTLRLSARFVNQTEYGLETSISYQQDSSRVVSISMTQNYALRARGLYELVVPELTGVAGFEPAWALSATTSLRWSAARAGGTLGLGIEPVLFDGATRRAAFSTDLLVP